MRRYWAKRRESRFNHEITVNTDHLTMAVTRLRNELTTLEAAQTVLNRLGITTNEGGTNG